MGRHRDERPGDGGEPGPVPEPGAGRPRHGQHHDDQLGEEESAGGGGVRDGRLAGFARGGQWEKHPPSARLAVVLERLSGPGWACPGAADEEMVAMAARWAAVESWAGAARLGVIRALIRAQDKPAPPPAADDDPDDDDPWTESLTHNLSLALASSAGAAERAEWLAWELGTRLPGIGALLEDGTLTYAKAKAIAEAFAHLTDDDAAHAQALITGQLPGKTWLQAQRLAQMAAAKADPAGAERRRREAEDKHARVRLWREQSGAAGLGGFDLPADETLAAHENVCARAGAYQASGAFPGARLDQLRAMAYLDLLNSVTARDRIAGAAPAPARPDDGPPPWEDPPGPATPDTPGPDGPDGPAEPAAPGDPPATPQAPGDPPDGDGPGSSNDSPSDGSNDDGGPGDDSDGSDDDDSGSSDGDGGSDGGSRGPGDGDGGSRGPDGGRGLDDDQDHSGNRDDGGEGHSGDGDPGSGGDGPEHGTPDQPRPGPRPAGRAGIDLIIPLITLLGLGNRPGEAYRLGPLDPGLCRKLAALAANTPRTEFCLTVTDHHGYAIAHGCARKPPARPPTAPSPPRTTTAQAAQTLTTLPARVNLTIPLTDLQNLTRPGRSPASPAASPGPASPASRGSPWALTPRAGGHGPPGGHGTWTLTLPGGRELTLRLEQVPTYDCDHARQSPGYQPSDTLRHLVQVRDGECTFPACTRHARESDFEHATPYHKGGKTCACNAGARSRKCHRIKQSKGWNLTQPKPGWHQWTTPTGHTYTQEPKRYPA